MSLIFLPIFGFFVGLIIIALGGGGGGFYVGFLMHLGLGNIDWKLVLLLALGTSTGAFFAPFLLSKFKKEVVEKYLLPLIIALTAIMGLMVFLK